MSEDYKTAFQKEINNRLKAKYESNKPKIFLGIITPIVGLILVYIAFFLVGRIEYAIQFVFEAILAIVVFDVLGFAITYVYIAWHKIPEEIYIEQRNIIEKRLPEKLSLKIERAPTNIIGIDGVDFKAAALLITSIENEKIVELRAIINFQHFFYETGTVRERGHDTNQLLMWSNNNSFENEIELRPNTLKILVVSKIDKITITGNQSVQMAVLGSNPLRLSMDFCEESIYKIKVLFQGKLEAEYKFRTLYYEDVIYTKPSSERILFLDVAEKTYKDIPAELLMRSKR